MSSATFGTAGHAQGMPIEGVTIASDQKREVLAVARQHSRDNLLISFDLVGLDRGHRRFHGATITRFPPGV